MRVTLIAKLACLAALGITTFFVTSSIVAGSQNAPRRRKPVSQGVQVAPHETPGPSTKMVVAGPGAASRPADGRVMAPIASFWLKNLDITAQDQDVFVSASANMSDKRPGMFYFWSMRVTDGANRNAVLNERHYTDQIFRIPSDGELNPTFNERLRLLPGDYLVEVALFQVPVGSDLAKLKDADWIQQQLVFRVGRRVTISQ